MRLFALLAALHRVLHRSVSVVSHAQVLVFRGTFLEALRSYNDVASPGGILWLLVNLLHLKVFDHYLVGELHHVWLNKRRSVPYSIVHGLLSTCDHH